MSALTDTLEFVDGVAIRVTVSILPGFTDLMQY